MALGRLDIHIQVAPFLATHLGNHHHRVAVDVLLIHIILAHVGALGKRQQLAIGVHPSVIVIHESPLVESRPFDEPKQLERLSHHIRIRTLQGKQRPVTACEVRTVHRLRKIDTHLRIILGRVVPEGLIELEELLSRLHTLFQIFLFH